MKIRSVKHLCGLGAKSVSGLPWGSKPIPVAFLISMQARMVQSYIDRGIYVYKPKNKKAKA